MSSLKEQKKEFREEVLALRQDMDEKTWASKTNLIYDRLIYSDFFKDASIVHTYVSMNQRKEVGTDEFIKFLFESEKTVVVPVTNFSDHSLTHVILTSFGELITNKWGVREPDRKSITIALDKIDLIVIPMAAGDRRGNRLGYGEGFYDRFLSKTNAYKVGLVFSDFLFDEIPAEKFDVKLDAIITEEELILP